MYVVCKPLFPLYSFIMCVTRSSCVLLRVTTETSEKYSNIVVFFYRTIIGYNE